MVIATLRPVKTHFSIALSETHKKIARSAKIVELSLKRQTNSSLSFLSFGEVERGKKLENFWVKLALSRL